MADVRIVSELSRTQLTAMFQSRTGPLARRMLRSGTRVSNEAKRNLMGRNGAPRRVRTGRLLNSISVDIVMVNSLPAARVGTNVSYAKYVHGGTGIYGPRGAPIRPVRARWLRWEYPAGHVHFAREVRGMKANHFLTDALHTVFRRS